MKKIINTLLSSYLFFMVVPLQIEDHFSVSEPTIETAGSSLVVNLPEVHVLPTSPLYEVKRSWEHLRLFLSQDPQQKTELLIQFADLRLAEAMKLIESKKFDQADILLAEHQTYMDTAEEIQSENETPHWIQTRLKASSEKKGFVELLTGEYRIRWEHGN